MRDISEPKTTVVLPEDGIQLSGEIAVERWENEGGPEKVEVGAVVAIYHTREEAEVAIHELQKTEGEARLFTIVGALEGAAAVGELSALNAQLINLGIPAESVAEYETQINAGMFALVAQGSVNEISQTKDDLATTP
jgi:hypothetical protein